MIMASMMSYLSLHHNFSNFSSRISPALALLTSQLSLRNSPEKIPMEFSGKELRFCRWDQLLRWRGSVETPVARLMGIHTPNILGVMRWPARCSGLAWLHHARVWFGGRSMLQLGGARWWTATPRMQIERWKGMVMWSSIAWSCGAWRPRSLIAAADPDLGDKEIDISEGLKIVESLKIYGGIIVTGSFFFTWYLLSIMFSIYNKKLFTYFPYPFFVSAVHLLVSVTYCLTSWSLGLRKWKSINIDLLGVLIPVAACHALGHVMSNISFTPGFTTSFTRIITVLEPLFTALTSQFVLGHQIPSSLWLSLAPLVIGVSMASWTGFSFNWRAFTRVLVSNISITYRNIYSKKAMTGMDNTSVYAYISIIALLFCLPAAILIDGPKLMQYGFWSAIVEVGIVKLVFDLLKVGMLYHIYNQITFNILERVAPLTHAVGNVFKFAFVIGFSIIVFGTSISTHNGIGIAMAIAGVAIYSSTKPNLEDDKRKSAQKAKTCVLTG